jgi:hypothetical protein
MEKNLSELTPKISVKDSRDGIFVVKQKRLDFKSEIFF